MRSWIGLMLLAAAGACGCNAPPVRRADEVSRFRAHLDQQASGVQIDARRPLTMARCEELALVNSLDLHVRNLALGLQDEQVKLALAGGLPKASLAYGEALRSNSSAIRSGEDVTEVEDRHQQRLTVAAVVPVLDWGLTYYAYQIALDQRRQERLLITRAEQLLRRDVRIAYAQHAGALRQLRLAQMAYQAAEQVLRVARSLEGAQMAVKADTALVEAALAQAALDLSLDSQRVEETHLVLSQLMSLPPQVKFGIDDTLPALPPIPTADQVSAYEDTALMSRPELSVQDLERHISANAVKREVAAFFPRLDGIGSFNWTSASQVVNQAFFLGGFEVTHALLDGGATLFRYDLAKKTVDLERARTLLISLGILYDVELRALRVRQGQETVIAADKLEKARRQGLDRVISLYKEGLEDEAGAARSLADLAIQATALDRAQTDYLVAWHELEAAALPASSAATQPTTQPAAEADRPPPPTLPTTATTKATEP